MLWVLKRTVSMRRFFEHPKHMFKFIIKNIIKILHSISGSMYRPSDKGGKGKLFFLFLKQNICCGYSKGSFDHPKHIIKLMYKKIVIILR